MGLYALIQANNKLPYTKKSRKTKLPGGWTVYDKLVFPIQQPEKRNQVQTT